ncbi:MAG: bifunctional ADP-dependent NAD(P)H-hydrate dehydratase/NAD(P)H-hydrate epimerase, partial [Acidobacteria bacterium]|nr:bifunctional ADP-dependent NAD(P)H-hydrate dehydratase/NAD(P)H-hydrate epimerase [Acidobacteriota bacterium]
MIWQDAASVRGLLPPRERDAHKGKFGHVLIVGGSPGRAGAAVLSARGALRSGAGLVTVACPASIRTEIA